MNDDELRMMLLLVGFTETPLTYIDYKWVLGRDSLLVGSNKHFNGRYDTYELGAGSNTFETADAAMQYIERYL